MVWYSQLFKNFPQFYVIHIDKGFSVVNEAEVDVFCFLFFFFFFELSYFLYDLTDTGTSS